jgi:SsrA-binding protein
MGLSMSKSASSKSSQKPNTKEVLVGENRKARYEYEILDTFEAGMVLRGTEVKVLRQGQISLGEAHAQFKGGQLFLINANIPEYSHGNLQNHEPKRSRKLLLNKKELKKIKEQSQVKGLTVVPLRVYFGDKGYAKCLLGVGRGRKTHDKRQNLKEKDARREMRQR